MTIQFLRYIVSVAEIGSITEAAKQLHVSQPSLSAALKAAEQEVGFQIFTRSRSGIALTKEGVEFLGYARQVIQEMNLLEDRFLLSKPEKQRFCVSTQHYTFTANAFVEMVQKFGQERLGADRVLAADRNDRDDCNVHLDRGRASDPEVLCKALSGHQYHSVADPAGVYLEYAAGVKQGFMAHLPFDTLRCAAYNSADQPKGENSYDSEFYR